MYLDFKTSQNLSKKYGIDVVETYFADSENSAKKATGRTGFPCVMKLNSAEHKTDIGGIITNIENHHQAELAFHKLKRKRNFNGVIVQKQLEGKEIIIGGKQDLQFGPVVLFGIGGVFVEIMKDFSLKIAPVTKKEAEYMIKSIQGYPILRGTRGEKSVNLNNIANAIVAVSNLISKHPEIQELDLNPLIVSENYCKAVDLRFIC